MIRYQWAKIYCTCRRLANCFALNILRLIVLADLSSFSCKFRRFSKVGGTSEDSRRLTPTAKWLRTACGLSVMSVTQDTRPYVNTKQETPGPWNLNYRFRQSGQLYFMSVWFSPIYQGKKIRKKQFHSRAKLSIFCPYVPFRYYRHAKISHCHVPVITIISFLHLHHTS